MTNPTEGMLLYDIDALDIVYKLLVNDSKLMDLVGHKDQVFKYHVPEEFQKSPPIIRISPISELPAEYADNEQLAWDCILQIDVWDSSNSREIAMKVHELMKTINFKQSTPTFEFDPDTYLVRDGRRYRGILLSKLKENEE